MANITLKIDDELLKKARQLAAKKNISINAFFKKNIQEFVQRELSREATLNGLDSFFRNTNARIGKKRWTRDDLHER